MKKNKWIATLLAVCSIGCLGIGAMDALSASADNEVTTNRTFLIQSGYKSGLFAPVSNILEGKGATVEFDLYNSDLKELNYNKNFNVMSSSGTSGSLSCVSFVFGKTEDYPYTLAPHCPAWHLYNLSEFNFGGFQYFSNGAIKEWGNQGMYELITDYVGDPSSFLDEGYSYKVSVRYDSFEYRGVEYGGDGGAWYCAESKGIFEDESDYEVLFAFKKKIGGSFTKGSMAGFEVQGLCKTANAGLTETSADGKGHSAHLEVDNVRIYDGTNYTDAQIKYLEDFEAVTEDMIETEDMSILASINKFKGKNYLALPSNIRSISANYGAAMGVSEETTCRFYINDRQLYTVYFKDKATGEVVATQKTAQGVDFSGKKVSAADQKVYKFDYSNIDFSKINGSVEVFGSPVSYFTMRLVSGVSGVNDKAVRVSVEGKYKLEEDILSRKDYDLVGFATQEGSTNVAYSIGDTVNMRCQDQTLYAVWRLKSFSTDYKVNKKTIATVMVGPGKTPFYQGETPQKDGYVFAGWSETIEPSRNKTVMAKFVEISDLNAENKALAVQNSLRFKREGFTFSSYVEVIFDLITLSNNASITLQGVDISQYMEEGYRMKISVSSLGKMVISKAYMNSNEYVAVASTETDMDTSTMNLLLKGNIVIDTLTMTYDGQNIYTENFEGITSISEGIYNNYYIVEGEGEIVPLAKDKKVTFVETKTGRTVAEAWTYAGGKVMLPISIEGSVEETAAWDLSQEALNNVQKDMVVNTSLTWQESKVAFVVKGVFNLIPVETSFDPITGIYDEQITLPTMVYENYAIIGWTDVENGNYAKYTDTYTLKGGNVTLYAVWGGKPITVEFYAEDGTTLLEKQIVEYKSTVRFGGEIPEKAGYKFVGWNQSTVGVSKDTKFVAVYEKNIRKDVMVSVLGGNGAGRYTEGEVVTISFRDIEGFAFLGWEVRSGGVTIQEKNGEYTFVVGAEDVVIEAKTQKKAMPVEKSSGCSSSLSLTTISAVALFGAVAFIFVYKRKERN